ncbi:hypothetical protein BBBOND_0100370 [Babesia bigemina]|uniref:Uncharacterized protein n=1 Tax=Babesia bigemina TaxID=5866 RepID=A0A061CZ32_BABBI|nr:hypothetical protein BBBOND_0100370 [Babesia bigemina]CDR93708.1 hypothetical protein BBBOND_0100370 [Babesia bigemina]|eukprot:XP_012765894.1 hypothetical protein BBBOND_0100370 [Babesia bigemina]
MRVLTFMATVVISPEVVTPDCTPAEVLRVPANMATHLFVTPKGLQREWAQCQSESGIHIPHSLSGSDCNLMEIMLAP